MKRETRLGGWPAAYACSLLGYLALFSLAWSQGPDLPSVNMGVMEATQGEIRSAISPALVGGLVLLQVFILLTGIRSLRIASRTQRGVSGRLRVRLGCSSGLLHVLVAWTGITWVLMSGDSLGVLPQDMGVLPKLMHTAADVMSPQLSFHGDSASLARIIFAGTAATTLISVLPFWLLLPKSFRRLAWNAEDLALCAAFIYVSVSLPLFPAEEGPRDLFGPSLRLGVTFLFASRALIRILPILLDAFERAGYQMLVATRHLRAKKSGFLATISALSIMAVAFSSCSLTTTLSVMGGFRQDLKNKILGNNAHVVVDHPDGVFEGWEPVLEDVNRSEGVQAATPVLTGEVMISSASNLAGALLRGIDTATVGDVTDLEGNMRWGELSYLDSPVRLLDLPNEDEDDEGAADSAAEPDSADSPRTQLLNPLRSMRTVRPGIVLGQELARNLRVYVGDEVDVVSPFGDLGPTGPMPKTRAFRVAGIFYSGMYEYDIKHAYVLLETAQRFLNTGDAISRVEIKAADVEMAPAVSATVANNLGEGGFRTRDWQELNRGLFGALALEKLAMFVALGIAILVAGFCVFGTLTLMVQEKQREVGVLKSMGVSRKEIVRIFMLEGAMIGIFGSLIGLGLGFVVGFAAENFGIRMDPQVYYIDRLPVQMDSLEFLWVGLTSAIVSLLATIVPAVLASRMQPVEALRHD